MTETPSLVALPDGHKAIQTDADIIAQLTSPPPVSASDKNVWAFWHAGFSSMRPWTQRNVIGWVRRLGPEWTVRVLDQIPGSSANVYQFLEASDLPNAVNEGTMTGHSVGPHTADLIRLPLLYRYGGVWMDVGTTLLRHLDTICWNVLADPATPYEICGFNLDVRPGITVMMNSFIASRRRNGFIRRWHAIYLALWKGVVTCNGFHKHPLLAHLPLLHPPVDKIRDPDRQGAMGRVTDYIAQIQCFERLRKLVDPSDAFNGPRYYHEKMYLFPALQEMYHLQMRTGWNGSEQFRLLSLRRDGDGVIRDELYLRAEDFVDDMLANSALMKLSHGPPGELDTLADLWDQPRYEDRDIQQGTFAEYIRSASVHYNQTREMVPLVLKLESEGVLHAGVVEVMRSSQSKSKQHDDCENYSDWAVDGEKL
ncbi:putative capsule polysaccharide biosynthesis protein [Aspergillus sclerotioniger CBS 115572]|uniref:Putative capsule polysaccharide biosynthesis protein n=1 Tax=Aspergillus sclerotioniger CBS 115572 TaxID=1450535 RepID=A0A317V0Z7_9EURO|nr:putative capsule polysaccharide biosynthesis protein [Aspergillus sclerotioniger CBS 115572]PWY67636.1 putative capsule polysaccharide biosynthesis protein [Aspergillus sclerotioniger CBS 115572]